MRATVLLIVVVSLLAGSVDSDGVVGKEFPLLSVCDFRFKPEVEQELSDTVNWFFRRTRELFVFEVQPGGSSSPCMDRVLQAIVAQNHVPVVYHKIRGNERKLSWSLFEGRDGGGGTGGGRSGNLFLAESFETIHSLFVDHLSADLNINRNGDFMFAIVDSSKGLMLNTSQKEGRMLTPPVHSLRTFFGGLWRRFDILNPLLVVVSGDGGGNSQPVIRDVDVGFYDPFEYVGGSRTESEGDDVLNWGQFYWAENGAWFPKAREGFVTDFRGYPIKLNQFLRYPTAIQRKHIPASVLDSYVYNKCTADDFLGHDGLILRNLELSLNFTKRNVLVPQEYGWVLDNGTFVGSIGEILRKDIDVSFNGRFIKYYDTFDVTFMTPVLFENFCLVAPKALRIPEYLMIFQCFQPFVWATLLLVNLLLGCLWFLTKRALISIFGPKHVERPLVASRDSLCGTIIEMWNIMWAAPAERLPGNNVERVFLVFVLMANMIIVGTFQGSLTTAFSTTNYYKDIDTLQEADHTQMPIIVGSRSIMDIFGTGGSALIQSLAAKMTLRSTGNTTSLQRTAVERGSFAVERKADLNVIIEMSFVSVLDGRPMVHVVHECPRDYYVAYLTRAGWPLLPSFNYAIQKFFEAGFIQKWYEVTENAIIDHHRLTTTTVDESMKPLSLIDIQTSFYLLGIGFAGCTLVFVSELLLGRGHFAGWGGAGGAKGKG